MRVDLDAEVRTADGESAGTLQWALMDPETREVTHFVISTDALFGRAVQVPREEVERASQDGEVLHLQLTKDQLEALPAHVPESYAPPPAGWEPAAGLAFPMGAYLWPSTVPAASADVAVASGLAGTAPGTFAPAPAGADVVAREDGGQGQAGDQPDIGIGKGATVIDAGGEDVGVVDELFFEEHTGTLRGFSLRVGGPLRTLFGGGETVEVPAHHVERIGESTVYLGIAKDQLWAPAAQA